MPGNNHFNVFRFHVRIYRPDPYPGNIRLSKSFLDTHSPDGSQRDNHPVYYHPPDQALHLPMFPVKHKNRFYNLGNRKKNDPTILSTGFDEILEGHFLIAVRMNKFQSV